MLLDFIITGAEAFSLVRIGPCRAISIHKATVVVTIVIGTLSKIGRVPVVRQRVAGGFAWVDAARKAESIGGVVRPEVLLKSLVTRYAVGVACLILFLVEASLAVSHFSTAVVCVAIAIREAGSVKNVVLFGQGCSTEHDKQKCNGNNLLSRPNKNYYMY